MKHLKLFALIILISCKNNRNNESITSTQTTPIEFGEDKNLFLNFYQGMSREQYEEALNKNVKESKLFIMLTEEEYERREHEISPDVFIGDEYIKKEAKVALSADIYTDIFSSILYKLTIGNIDYFATVIPEFNDSYGLHSITIKTPVTLPYLSDEENVTDIRKSELINKIKNLKRGVYDLYKTKYGEPKIINNHFDDFDLKVLGVNKNEESFDPNNYHFETENKTIILSQRLGNRSIDMSPEIRYILNSDLLMEKQNKLDERKSEINRKKQEERLKEQKNKNTINDL